MKSLYRAAIAASALFAAALSPASAAPVLVAGFYHDNAAANCPNANRCVAVFSPIPAGRLVVVGRVNCRIFAGGGGITVSTIDGNLSALQNLAPTIRAQYFLPVRLDPGENLFFVNEEVDMLFGPTSRPGIQIVLNTSPPTFNMQCQITGRVIN